MKFLRFADLKERGIVRNWTTLLRLIKKQDFPPGVRIGAQTRGWTEDEIKEWLETRRIPRPARSDEVAAEETA